MDDGLSRHWNEGITLNGANMETEEIPVVKKLELEDAEAIPDVNQQALAEGRHGRASSVCVTRLMATVPASNRVAKRKTRLTEATWDAVFRRLALVVSSVEDDGDPHGEPSPATYFLEEIGQDDAEWLARKCGSTLRLEVVD